jgi:hypothetical protein
MDIKKIAKLAFFIIPLIFEVEMGYKNNLKIIILPKL